MESQKKHPKRFSFEFFPAKTPAGQEKLLTTAKRLAEYKPDFFSVTYGAAGSTRDRTKETVLAITEATHVDTAPHLSCIGANKEEIADLLKDYQAHQIKRIVALRGDMPSGMGLASGELRYANELVSFIRETTQQQFILEVAAYPEIHPQAPNAEKDLENFKRKVDAGANAAITQYFYNADSYFYFVERCEKLGINIPITPGIMPITNYTKLARFSDACGAELPRWIRKQLEAYGDDITSIRQFGEDVITQLCERLLDAGAPGIHFYTLNQADPSLAVWNNLNLSNRR
ncbi:methylenetetrahydrofolate reductase [NAD(P)H] [Zooshikella sp. RANM57]|uniref:methylenetetrahydrofolate reductase [NAD(P)H] n=1 Tax=Zooshikella sp. RANM57 TaxID=3425863 RepID=UPI003D6DA9C6